MKNFALRLDKFVREYILGVTSFEREYTFKDYENHGLASVKFDGTSIYFEPSERISVSVAGSAAKIFYSSFLYKIFGLRPGFLIDQSYRNDNTARFRFHLQIEKTFELLLSLLVMATALLGLFGFAVFIGSYLLQNNGIGRNGLSMAFAAIGLIIFYGLSYRLIKLLVQPAINSLMESIDSIEVSKH